MKKEKPPKWQKTLLWITLSFLALIILIVIFSPDKNTSAKEHLSKVTKDSVKETNNDMSFASDSIKFIEKADSLAPIIDSFIRVNQEVYSRNDGDVLLKQWQKIAFSFYYNLGPFQKIPVVAAEYQKMKDYQQMIYPKLRIAFYKNAKKKLWAQDVYVSISGKRDDIIIFNSDNFYTNKNIKAANDAIKGILNDYRFKKAIYGRDEDGSDPQTIQIYDGNDKDMMGLESL